MSARAHGRLAAHSSGLSSRLVDICVSSQWIKAVGVLTRPGDPGAELAVRCDRHSFRVRASLDLVDEGPEAPALVPRFCLMLQDAPALFLFAPGLLGESPPALDLSASRLLSLALLLPCPLRVGDDDEPDDDMIELRLYRVRRSGCPGRPRLASLRRGVTIPATGPRGDGPRAHRGVYREEARPW